MLISATYVCPEKGLISLEPPDPIRLSQTAKVAKSLGLNRLHIPVLEEALLGVTRSKVHYLEGLVQALDRVAEAKITATLISPAQRILGLDFVPPPLVRGVRDPRAGQVFVDGKVRNLWPFDWWADPSLIQKRIKTFRELMDAVSGHPALSDWLILDRALEWARPGIEAADLVLRSYLAEIRERDELGEIALGLGWSELLDPDMAQALTSQVDRIRMSGLDMGLWGLERPENLADELLEVAYLATLAYWLLGRPTEVEIGWSTLKELGDPEEIAETGRRLVGQGITGVDWLSLIDPQPPVRKQPPWVLKSGLDRVGLLSHSVEPKEHVETLLGVFRSGEADYKIEDFIDISKEEYVSEPHTHLPRMWEHFRESI